MQLEDKVISIIEKNIEKQVKVTLESHLVEDLGVGSFDKLMIIAAIEDEFQANVDAEDFKDVLLVSDIVKKIEEHLKTTL